MRIRGFCCFYKLFFGKGTTPLPHNLRAMTETVIALLLDFRSLQ